ncbi:MAG TPA: LysR family transcriptional regulator [Pseudomonas xinjiangensis]|uniref:LysR family transcriptional regulator n=2 Tax=root TaxID=1 RepID=A0A7V1FTH6_9GAMM|nr:LysR family transcriptional regulator [Halopseudomonas xinjiangensis]HEC46074.1 LysR family transcriptional regulator [Halopseudomonas xinjiangensis]
MNEVHMKGDLNLFRVLLVVAETGSTTEASERLNLSQSAVSHSLKRLRTMLGDPLFVKHGRHLVMTAHARSILPQVKAALASLSSTALRAEFFDPTRSNMIFQCGFRDAMEFLVIPELMGRLRDEGWQVTFKSQRVVAEDIEHRILTGALDIAVDIEHPVSGQLASREISREKLCVMVGPKHPCFAGGSLSLQQFVDSEHVLVTLTSRERAFVDQHLVGIGNQRRIALHCEHYHAAAQAVAQTDLILTMPYSYAYSLARLNGNRLLPVPFYCSPVPVRIYWRNSLSEEPYMRWLIGQVESLIGAIRTKGLSSADRK